ncbi:MAG: hypothetical protein NDJ18_06365 [candidate division Zixibacteria bacterium]|nr:hypothetical protein [candidate division Zixibacteria bacterium]
MTRSYSSILAVALLLIIAGATSIQAQVNWWRLDNETAITMEWSKADFAGRIADELGFFNTILFLGAQIRVSPSVNLVAELPITTWDVKDPMVYDLGWYFYDWEDEQAIGNPYLGLEYSRPGAPILFALGVRPPLASDDKLFAAVVGLFGAADRFEAFVPDLWTFSLAIGGRSSATVGPAYRFLIGPTLLVPDAGDAEVLLDWSALFGFRGTIAHAGFEYAGRMILTENYDDLGDRFDQFIGLVGGLNIGQVEPGVQFRYAIDDEYREWIDFTFGINLKIRLGAEEE